MSEPKNLDAYNKLKSPMLVICMFSFLLSVLLIVALRYDMRPFPLGILELDSTRKSGQLIFLLYTTIFAAIWLTYFLSKSTKIAFFQRRTLRLLLLFTSENWGALEERIVAEKPSEPLILTSLMLVENEEQVAEIEAYFRDKARSATQNLGMLLAVACLELAQISFLKREATQMDEWATLTLGIASIASITAFVMFVVATDSLDTIFNRFRLASDRHRLIDHFYRASINPRYYGLSLLILSAVMLIGNREPVLGAVAFGIVFAIGYHHWFPRISSDGSIEGEGVVQGYVSQGFKMSVVFFPLVFSYFFI